MQKLSILFMMEVNYEINNTVASIEKNDDLRPMNLEQGVLINDKLR